ncbi:MAG: nucleoside monophosphate kinase [Parachlamydiales bacterium]|jgi:adenylate kinase
MNSLYKSVLIFGPPGSGKGTISKFLSLSDSIYHVSTGDIFRSLNPASEKGKMVKSYLDKGLLIPDEVTVDIWSDFMESRIKEGSYGPSKQYLLLDGIPRTLKQACLLEKFIKVEYIIVLSIENYSKLIDRIQKRAKIEGRKDDLDVKVLGKRMDIYLEETMNLLKHYPKNITFEFNADQKKLEVIRDILVKFASIL